MVNSDKKCACKGIRKCLLCEDLKSGVEKLNDDDEYSLTDQYIYCDQCGNRAYLVEYFEKHLDYHSGNSSDLNDLDLHSIEIDGVFVQRNVIEPEEELELVSYIDSRFEWVESQSGRRKQDFGPKINFKKKKLNFGNFSGLPKLDMEILDTIRTKRLCETPEYKRFESEFCRKQDFFAKNILNNFQTVEVCHLEYRPERGSSIDPHYDDFWIWGERLITLNLLSSTAICLTLNPADSDLKKRHQIRVDLPARSIMALYGDARFRYQHSIRRADIVARRLAITYRELPLKFIDESTEEFRNYGKEFMTKALLRI